MDGITQASAPARHNTTHNRLRPIELTKLRPGYHHDGGGLYLDVRGGKRGESRTWVYRYTRDGKAHTMGLGPLHTLGLADARERAKLARQSLLDGVDPVDARRIARAARRVAEASAMTFKEAAEAYMAAHHTEWKNPKHAAQWASTLATYVYPVFGHLPVQAVDVGLVMKAIEPIWATKPETASRVRGRIESVLDWATARDYRQGPNPARWRGHLENLLASPESAKRAARKERQRGDHFEALPYAEIAGFTSFTSSMPKATHPASARLGREA